LLEVDSGVNGSAMSFSSGVDTSVRAVGGSVVVAGSSRRGQTSADVQSLWRSSLRTGGHPDCQLRVQAAGMVCGIRTFDVSPLAIVVINNTVSAAMFVRRLVRGVAVSTATTFSSAAQRSLDRLQLGHSTHIDRLSSKLDGDWSRMQGDTSTQGDDFSGLRFPADCWSRPGGARQHVYQPLRVTRWSRESAVRFCAIGNRRSPGAGEAAA
jgi:hypothetical protein